jgi:hypothetical protein
MQSLKPGFWLIDCGFIVGPLRVMSHMILNVEPVSAKVVPSLPGQDVVRPPVLVLAPALADGWSVCTEAVANADENADGAAMGVTCAC